MTGVTMIGSSTSVLTDLLDAFGTRIDLGDEVLYAFSRSSSSVIFCRAVVVGRTAKKVRIVVKDCRQHGAPAYDSIGPMLVVPYQIVKSLTPPD